MSRPRSAKEFQRLLQDHAAEIGQPPQRVLHLVRVAVVCAMVDAVRHDDGGHLFVVKGGTGMQLRRRVMPKRGGRDCVVKHRLAVRTWVAGGEPAIKIRSAPMTTNAWREVNRANWESRVPIHSGPGGYELAAFDDPDHLSNVVRYDLPRLGRIDGLDVVHLQCHIGTDTVGLARLGARNVTGLDFSPSALTLARVLATRAKVAVEFVESDVYDAVDTLGPAACDLVYTGIGAICWLPDIVRWAQVVADLLRPGGRLFIREGHPVLWSLCDPRPDGLLVVEFPYFETDGVAFSEEASYAGEGTIASPDTIHFNHGLGEIFNALWAAGLTITAFDEHREVPWNQLGEAMVASDTHDGEFVLAGDQDRIPLSYTLQAVKPPD